MHNIDQMIRDYYKAFNERRFEDAAALYTADAVIQHRPDGSPLKGPEGYIESSRLTMAVAPDLQLQVLRVEQRGDTIVEIDVLATGTHQGDWNMGALGVAKATGSKLNVRVREMLEIRGGMITFSSLSYDLQDFVGKPRPPR